MKSWMTRFARAGWWGPSRKIPVVLVKARSDSAAPASNPCWPSRCASATPPRPPPKRQRNSRRDKEEGECGFMGADVAGQRLGVRREAKRHAALDCADEQRLSGAYAGPLGRESKRRRRCALPAHSKTW